MIDDQSDKRIYAIIQISKWWLCFCFPLLLENGGRRGLSFGNGFETFFFPFPFFPFSPRQYNLSGSPPQWLAQPRPIYGCGAPARLCGYSIPRRGMTRQRMQYWNAVELTQTLILVEGAARRALFYRGVCACGNWRARAEAGAEGRARKYRVWTCFNDQAGERSLFGARVCVYVYIYIYLSIYIPIKSSNTKLHSYSVSLLTREYKNKNLVSGSYREMVE